MSEFTQKVKALITSQGGTVTSGEGLQASDIKQYAEIAQLYYGVLPHVALMGLAFPESLPANLTAALGADEPAPEGDAPEGDPEAGVMSLMAEGGDDTSDTGDSAEDTVEDTTEDTVEDTEATDGSEDPAVTEEGSAEEPTSESDPV